MTRKMLALLLVVAACGGSSADTTIEASTVAAPSTTVAATSGPQTTAVATTAAATTEAPPAPTTTSPAPSTSAVAEGPVALVDQGLTDLSEGGVGRVSYAVVFQNMTEDQIATGVEVTVTFLDEAGAVVGNVAGTVDFIMPGTKGGLADSAFDIGGATSMEVDFEVGGMQAADPETVGAFTITNGTLKQGEFSTTLLAVAKSSFPETVVSPQAAIVYYDANQNIIGGDFTFVDFVPGKGELPFLVFVEEALDVVGAEILLQPSVLSTLPQDAQVAENLDAVGVGFTLDANDIASYGLVLNNPNQGLAAEFVQVVLSFWDSNNRLVAVRNEPVGLVLAGEVVAVAGDLFEAGGAETVIAQWLVNSWTELADDTVVPLTAEDAIFLEDTFSNKVRATVLNDGDSVAETVEVVAILFDSAGKVIGGGLTFVDFIPAGGTAPAEMITLSGVIPDEVGVFPRRTLLP